MKQATAHEIPRETGRADLVSCPQHGLLDRKVAALNFDRLKWKLSRSPEAKLSPEMCELAEREYRRFLTLQVAFPGIDLVPSKLADEFWHAHILDTAAYAPDCEKVFGYFLHHFPYFGIYGEDDRQRLEAAFAETNTLYQGVFGEAPPMLSSDSEAARCKDHACHKPSSCGCRTSGACK